MPIVKAIHDADLVGLTLLEYLGLDPKDGVPTILPLWLAGYRDSVAIIGPHLAKKRAEERTE